MPTIKRQRASNRVHLKIPRSHGYIYRYIHRNGKRYYDTNWFIKSTTVRAPQVIRRLKAKGLPWGYSHIKHHNRVLRSGLQPSFMYMGAILYHAPFEFQVKGREANRGVIKQESCKLVHRFVFLPSQELLDRIKSKKPNDLKLSEWYRSLLLAGIELNGCHSVPPVLDYKKVGGISIRVTQAEADLILSLRKPGEPEAMLIRRLVYSGFYEGQLKMSPYSTVMG